MDRATTPLQRKIFARFPLVQKAARSAIYFGRESHILGFRYQPRLMQVAQKLALHNLTKAVSDPVLREKLTPTFTLGCKRVLLSNTYYPALAQPNADVIAERVRADGTSLKEHRAASGGMQALNGTTIAGFPNFFLLVGPNTGLGHNSIVLMIEAQVGHLLLALDAVEAAGAGALEPWPEVQAAYNERIQAALKKTVWNRGGCQSWYLDENGRNTTRGRRSRSCVSCRASTRPSTS
jgi:cation diffusion facilitator CzcD-associated flavoprotein CzcO